jgi:hypothetical protein
MPPVKNVPAAEVEEKPYVRPVAKAVPEIRRIVDPTIAAKIQAVAGRMERLKDEMGSTEIAGEARSAAYHKMGCEIVQCVLQPTPTRNYTWVFRDIAPTEFVRFKTKDHVFMSKYFEWRADQYAYATAKHNLIAAEKEFQALLLSLTYPQ